MPKFRLHKLVRDKLLDDYIAQGQQPEYRMLKHDEHSAQLIAKLHEEADELQAAAPDEIAAELADSMQILHDLAWLHGISLDELEKVRTAKEAKKGGFQKGVYIESLTLADDDDWVDYYRRDPQWYPEVE